MPTFTDLLKFRLFFNVKDYASPIQEDKRGIIPATLEDFCEKFTQVTPYGTAMKFHCADDAVICGRHLSVQITSITMWQISLYHLEKRLYGTWLFKQKDCKD